MSQLRQKIVAAIHEAAEMRDLDIHSKLEDDTVLLDSGLDSLGFAVLVARLEEELGYDPFVMMEEPVYPRTLGEFVSIYKRFSPSLEA